MKLWQVPKLSHFRHYHGLGFPSAIQVMVLMDERLMVGSTTTEVLMRIFHCLMKKYLPAISFGLRDFIGTGWYSSEYIVGTKSIGNLELTAGLGFGRLAGRDSFPIHLAHCHLSLINGKGINFWKGRNTWNN